MAKNKTGWRAKREVTRHRTLKNSNFHYSLNRFERKLINQYLNHINRGESDVISKGTVSKGDQVSVQGVSEGDTGVQIHGDCKEIL